MRQGGRQGGGVCPRPAGGDGAPRVFLSGYGWRDGVRPRSYRGTRPRFASGTLMSRSDDTAPPRTKHYQSEPVHLPEATSGYPLGCSPQRSKEERSTREGGFPCRSVGRSAPAASHRNACRPQNRLVAGHTQQLIRANASPTLRVQHSLQR